MSPSPSQWMEIAFDLTYLVVIYALVAAMTVRLATRTGSDPLLHRFRDGFLLLAVGDTGHVGLRAVALLRGGLDARVDVLGLSVPLVGVGAFSTAVTVTLLYLLLLDAWRVRFAPVRTRGYWALVAVGLLRLVLLLPADNRWADAMPPWDWSLLRNGPLAVLGLGVAWVFLRDGVRKGDRTFWQLGALITLSFAFYVPVILLVQRVPAIGVLMVPKTLVYLAMAWLALARLFKRPGTASRDAPSAHPPGALSLPS